MNRIVSSFLLLLLPVFGWGQSIKIVSDNQIVMYASVMGQYQSYTESGTNITFCNLMEGNYKVKVSYSPRFQLSPRQKSIDVYVRRGEKVILTLDAHANVYRQVVRDENGNVDYDRNVYRQPPYPYNMDMPQIMTNKEFNNFIRAIQKQPFDDDKYKTASAGSKNVLFYTSQVYEIIKAFRFDGDEKLLLAKQLYSQTVDKQNYYQVAECFTFSSSKNELLDYINSKR